jgi:hypothetical protein
MTFNLPVIINARKLHDPQPFGNDERQETTRSSTPGEFHFSNSAAVMFHGKIRGIK